MRKYLIISLLASYSIVFAGESEDFKAVDNLYKERNFKAALVESEKFLQKYPESKHQKSMRDKVAKIYFLEKNYKKAEELFKKLFTMEEKQSQKDEYASYLARANALLNNSDSAMFYLRGIKDEKVYQKTYFAVAQDFLAKENNEAAKKAYTEIINNKYENYKEAMMGLGIVNYNLKDYDKAIYWLSEFSKAMPSENKEMVSYLRASALYRKGNTDEAIRQFEDLANVNPSTEYSRKAALYLIEIYSNRKDEAKVSFYLDKIKGTKEYNTAMTMIGDLYVTKENYDKALDYYNQSDDKNNPRLIYGEAYSLYKNGKYEEALKKFQSLKNSDYYNQSIYHIFAINYKLKNFDEIIRNREIIRKVVVSQVDTDNIIRIIANSAYQVGNYKLAKDYYGRLFAVSPDKENLFRVILLDSQMLDMEDLRIRFNQYNELYSNDTEFKKDVYLYTGDAYYKAGDPERAEQIYKTYLNQYTNTEVMSSLMSALLEQKKYDEMEQYLSLAQDESSVDYLKGIAAMGLGKYDEAESQFQKVLASGDESLSTKVYLNRVRNFFLAERYNEAVQAGEQYLSSINSEKEKSIYSEMLDKIGLSYFRLGKYDQARSYYSKIANMKGYEVYGKFQIADSYYNEKNYERAGNLYKEVYNQYGETFYGEQAYYKYIMTLSLTGNTEAFEREKNNFLSVYPNSNLRGTITNLTTNMYIESGDTDKAIESLNESSSNTNDTSIKENNTAKIITLKLQKKDYKDIEKYIAELPTEEERVYYTAQYYAVKKDPKVVKEYETLLQYDKYKAYASKGLGDYYFDKKDLSKAKKYYGTYTSVNKNPDEYILYRLGQANEKENNLKMALTDYKAVYTKNGKLANDAMLRAAEIYDKQENVIEAEKLFTKLYAVKNNKDLKAYSMEKLIYYKLVKNNTKEAKKLYDELRKIDAKRAEKFKAYF
ncbi:tetratricopeptide repeat protein [Fusobacterium simiae]|uniref:Tetratricopeptide repeat protein n=1 Tax=Fusobacterium simiae TaxID=855 RepID=A0ABT4DJQ7_FUSSI|nr:tetratricopeptide repeat protein [Fusobacterium simiae]MCY7008193.1 tetratricopeptide repeat protein [Fusobacterium simiae]